LFLRFLHIVFLFFPLFLGGQSRYAPSLKRACLDRVTGELTLLLEPGKDTCSFQKYRLWGRTDALASYELLDEATNFNLLTWNKVLPNKKKWELYVSSHFICGGRDSFLSNTLFIDDTPPSYVEPDSVSVDFLSQRVIAGWTNPPDTDIWGYSLFKVDASGNNILIDEQNVLFYSYEVADFNSKSLGNKIAIAAYDSCRNGGVISSYHSPVLLQVQTNPNYLCDKGIQLSWSPYIGWGVNEYEVVIRNASNNALIYRTRVSGTTTNFNYTLPSLDVNLDVFVRAFKAGSSISSTSNRVALFVSDFPKPNKATQLYFCSVSDINRIDLQGYSNPGDSFNVYYRTTGSAWTLTYNESVSGGTFNHSHFGNDTRLMPVEFLLVRYNSCGSAADSSLIIRSIHLSATNRNLQWNNNLQWSALAASEDFFIEKEESGVWSDIGSTTGLIFELPPFGAYWVRIKGETNLWSAEDRGYSYSNPVWVDLGFDSSLLDTLLIPNAFTPEGNNPIFKISNPAISTGESTMYIYNRWGEKVFEGDALVGWDGRIGGDFALDGFYIYKVTALYRRKRIEKAGTVLLLR